MKFKSVAVATVALALAGGMVWDRPFGRIYYVPSSSMTPTLPLGARLWASPFPYRVGAPRTGDITILELPLSLVSPGSGTGTTDYVKRIIDGPGDRVEMSHGVLKRNGRAQKEPYITWSGNPPYDFKVVNGQVYEREPDEQNVTGFWIRGDVLVPMNDQAAISRAKSTPLPPDKFLVLGDNRGNSNDSHVFGLVDRSQIKAKVTMRLSPDPRVF